MSERETCDATPREKLYLLKCPNKWIPKHRIPRGCLLSYSCRLLAKQRKNRERGGVRASENDSGEPKDNILTKQREILTENFDANNGLNHKNENFDDNSSGEGKENRKKKVKRRKICNNMQIVQQHSSFHGDEGHTFTGESSRLPGDNELDELPRKFVYNHHNMPPTPPPSVVTVQHAPSDTPSDAPSDTPSDTDTPFWHPQETDNVCDNSTKTELPEPATATGYLCEVCGKKFTRKYGLKIHTRLHQGVKPLQCDVCDKTFADPSNMAKHMRVHGMSGRVEYYCPYCDERMTKRKKLLRHIEVMHEMRGSSTKNRFYNAGNHVISHGAIIESSKINRINNTQNNIHGHYISNHDKENESVGHSSVSPEYQMSPCDAELYEAYKKAEKAECSGDHRLSYTKVKCRDQEHYKEALRNDYEAYFESHAETRPNVAQVKVIQHSQYHSDWGERVDHEGNPRLLPDKEQQQDHYQQQQQQQQHQPYQPDELKIKHSINEERSHQITEDTYANDVRSPTEVFTCKICTKQFGQMNSLSSHLDFHYAFHKCRICDKQCASGVELISHHYNSHVKTEDDSGGPYDRDGHYNSSHSVKADENHDGHYTSYNFKVEENFDGSYKQNMQVRRSENIDHQDMKSHGCNRTFDDGAMYYRGDFLSRIVHDDVRLGEDHFRSVPGEVDDSRYHHPRQTIDDMQNSCEVNQCVCGDSCQASVKIGDHYDINENDERGNNNISGRDYHSINNNNLESGRKECHMRKHSQYNHHYRNHLHIKSESGVNDDYHRINEDIHIHVPVNKRNINSTVDNNNTINNNNNNTNNNNNNMNNDNNNIKISNNKNTSENNWNVCRVDQHIENENYADNDKENRGKIETALTSDNHVVRECLRPALSSKRHENIENIGRFVHSENFDNIRDSDRSRYSPPRINRGYQSTSPPRNIHDRKYTCNNDKNGWNEYCRVDYRVNVEDEEDEDLVVDVENIKCAPLPPLDENGSSPPQLQRQMSHNDIVGVLENNTPSHHENYYSGTVVPNMVDHRLYNRAAQLRASSTGYLIPSHGAVLSRWRHHPAQVSPVVNNTVC